jgi:voltage-gated potassium channel Kch
MQHMVGTVVGRGLTVRSAVRIVATFTLTTVFVSALVMWLVDRDGFPHYGTALWWSIQTVTTVGYGDIVPQHAGGRLVAAVTMLAGIALITVVAGAVASGLVESLRRSRGADREGRILAELEDLHRRLDELGAPPRRPPEDLSGGRG